MNYRHLRLGKTMREELGRLIERYVTVPRALVTLTDVELDEKLEHARIRVSVLPAGEGEYALAALKASEWKLRRELAKKIRIRALPEFRFELDLGLENAAKVEKLLLKEENK